jgi:DNA-binding transcriptional regulator GbsR (MarR family)
MDYETERTLQEILDRLERLERYIYGTRKEEGLKEYIDRELSNLYEQLDILRDIQKRLERLELHVFGIEPLLEKEERKIREQIWRD